MELVSRDDGDLDGVEGLSSLEGEALLDDVVEDPSSLVDEAARGVGLDQPRLELCFLRWNDVKTLSLTLKSVHEIGRASCRERVFRAV